MVKKHYPNKPSEYREELTPSLDDDKFISETTRIMSVFQGSLYLKRLSSEIENFKRILPTYVENIKTLEEGVQYFASFKANSDNISLTHMEYYKQFLINSIASAKTIQRGISKNGGGENRALREYIKEAGHIGYGLFYSGRGFTKPSEEAKPQKSKSTLKLVRNMENAQYISIQKNYKHIINHAKLIQEAKANSINLYELNKAGLRNVGLGMQMLSDAELNLATTSTALTISKTKKTRKKSSRKKATSTELKEETVIMGPKERYQANTEEYLTRASEQNRKNREDNEKASKEHDKARKEEAVKKKLARAEVKDAIAELTEGDFDFALEFALDQASYDAEVEEIEEGQEEGGEEDSSEDVTSKAQIIIEKMLSGETYLNFINYASKLTYSLFSALKVSLNISDKMDSLATPMVGNFSDIFDTSIKAMLGVLRLATTGLSISFSMVNGMLGAVQGILKTLGGSNKDDDDDDEEDSDEDTDNSEISSDSDNKPSLKTSILNAVTSVLRTILQAFALGFQAISAVITAGISLFIGVFQNILSLVKQISSTSPVMEQVLNIMNLALIMFFLPFANMFANALLDMVYSFVLKARDWGSIFGSIFGELIIGADKISTCFGEIAERIEVLGVKFAEVFLPLIAELMPIFLKFCTYFIETLLDNKDSLFSMLKAGISACKELLNNNIIAFFLKFGIDAMKFIDSNADWIVKIIKICVSLTDEALALTLWVIKHFWAFCVMIGGAIVSLLSMAIAGVAVYGSVVGLLARAGIKLFAQLSRYIVLLSGVAGFGLGALLGLGLWYVLFDFKEFGKGGYIPATPGGTYAIVAERETEYIIPKSKMNLIRGHNNLVIEFNGRVLGTDNFTKEVTEAVTNNSIKSAYR